MRRVLFLVGLLVLAVRSPVYALDPAIPGVLQNAAAATGDGTAMVVSGFASVGVQVVLTDAVVTFEATVDGSNWVAVLCSLATDATTSTTALASGLYQCSVAGYNQFRARVSSFSSGTVTVKALAITAKLGGAGGGGVGAETDTLATVCARGCEFEGADGTTPLSVGDGTTQIEIGVDAGGVGPFIRTNPATDVRQQIPTNQTGGVYSHEGDCDVEGIDPDAATPQAGWTYECTTIRPLGSVWIPAGAMSTDGTQCATPAEVTINSGAKRYTIICADNDGSTAYAEVAGLDDWDGGTILVRGYFVQTAADTSNLNSDIAASCRPDSEIINNTWGTEVAMDGAMEGSSNLDTFITTAVTPNGTCTGAGTLLQLRWQLDAGGTTTAVATLHLVGFQVKYTKKSRSH